MNWLLTLGLLFACFTARADDMTTVQNIDAEKVLLDLESDPTVFGATYAGVQQFAEKYNLEVESLGIRPVREENPNGPFEMMIIIAPKDRGERGTYPYVRVEAYFDMPTHFQRTVQRLNRARFYKVDVTNEGPSGGPQSGGISSAG